MSEAFYKAVRTSTERDAAWHVLKSTPSGLLLDAAFYDPHTAEAGARDYAEKCNARAKAEREKPRYYADESYGHWFVRDRDNGGLAVVNFPVGEARAKQVADLLNAAVADTLNREGRSCPS